jgi:Uma2 family endonuclease
MSIANKILPHYTYDDWIHWEGSWELIEGHPIAMSPAPTPRHQKISAKIITVLSKALESSNCKHCSVYNFIDYRVEEDTILQPDVLGVFKEITKKYLDFTPSFVVEILSPATALKDRHTKLEIYQQKKIAYYLIVDTDKEIVELFQLKNEAYELQPQKRVYDFIFEDGCTIKIDFSGIFY